MKHRIKLKAELESYASASEYLMEPGDAVLIQRGSPRWLLLQCPCGCGENIPVNLDQRAGKAWRLYRGPSSGLTLFPSVWRDTGCQSHFIIWRDRILLFGLRELTDDVPRDSFDITNLSRKVLSVWPNGRFVSYLEIADELEQIPWDVQEACRHLVNDGELIEGYGELRGQFRRTSD